jgi:hypothetical protein
MLKPKRLGKKCIDFVTASFGSCHRGLSVTYRAEPEFFCGDVKVAYNMM